MRRIYLLLLILSPFLAKSQNLLFDLTHPTGDKNEVMIYWNEESFELLFSRLFLKHGFKKISSDDTRLRFSNDTGDLILIKSRSWNTKPISKEFWQITYSTDGVNNFRAIISDIRAAARKEYSSNWPGTVTELDNYDDGLQRFNKFKYNRNFSSFDTQDNRRYSYVFSNFISVGYFISKETQVENDPYMKKYFLNILFQRGE